MSRSVSVGYSTLKSVLFTYSKMSDGVFDCGSRTMSSRWITLVPPRRFCRILISRLIFFFFTGLRILMITFEFVRTSTPSNTSEYLPRPTFRTTS